MRNIFTQLLAISVVLGATSAFARVAAKSTTPFKVTACPADKNLVEKMTLIFTEENGVTKLTQKTVAGKWIIGEGNPKYSTEVYDIDATKTQMVSVDALIAVEVYVKNDDGTTSQMPIRIVKFRNPKNIEKFDNSKDIIDHYVGGGEDFKAEYCK